MGEGKKDILYVVVPCYNEEEVLPETSKRLSAQLVSMYEHGEISEHSRVLFVDDGSGDRTWELICSLHENDKTFSGIRLSRNRGHQNALLAGLMTAREYADITVSIDADLQDDVSAIPKMVEEYHRGSEIVYGVRSSRKTDTVFKRATAQGYYRFMKWLGADIVYNHADCRLMSRKALDGLSEFEEVNLFLRGMVPLIGYKSSVVEYKRSERFAGESKYNLRKMLSFAADGITSFSIKPIKIISRVGILISVMSAVVLLIELIKALSSAAVSRTWLIIGAMWLLGGIQLIAAGVVGEYVGKIYSEAKHRPRYIISESLITQQPPQ